MNVTQVLTDGALIESDSEDSDYDPKENSSGKSSTSWKTVEDSDKGSAKAYDSNVESEKDSAEKDEPKTKLK